MLEFIILGLSVLALFTLGLGGWVIGTYNTFKTGQQDISTQWSNIKTEYQRRADLFFNLVETVKSHKKFEKSTLVEVVKARSGNFGSSPQTEAKSMKKLDSVFSKLMLLFEQYPVLKSSEQHNKLMDELRITEDRINVARTDYNEIVGDFNKVVTMFPTNFLAGIFAIKQAEFFKNEASTDTAPKISLD